MRSNSKRHIVRFKRYDKERFVNINNGTEIVNFGGRFVKRFNNRSNQLAGNLSGETDTRTLKRSNLQWIYVSSCTTAKRYVKFPDTANDCTNTYLILLHLEDSLIVHRWTISKLNGRKDKENKN